MHVIKNLLSSVFAVCFLVLGYSGLQQINACQALINAYDSLQLARENGYEAQAKSLESEIPELRSKIDGNLKIYINFSMLSLIGIVFVEHQYRAKGS